MTIHISSGLVTLLMIVLFVWQFIRQKGTTSHGLRGAALVMNAIILILLVIVIIGRMALGYELWHLNTTLLVLHVACALAFLAALAATCISGALSKAVWGFPHRTWTRASAALLVATLLLILAAKQFA